jgi:hypothetical protein
MHTYFFYLLVYPAILLLSIFIGRKIAVRSLGKNHQWKPLGLENGIMGFYALLTSFTLVQSGGHANERDVMIHTIADDISEVLRVSGLDEPALHQRVRVYFSDFYGIINHPAETDEHRIAKRINTIDSLDNILDADMRRYIKANPDARVKITTMLAKIDRMESTYYRFIYSYDKSVPKIILLMLVLFSLFIGFMMGFIGRFYGNHIHISTTTFVVMSILILNIIHDLDSPAVGFIKPDFSDIGEVMHTFRIAPAK